MVFKTNRVRAAIKIHVHVKFHRAKCSGSRVIMVTEKTTWTNTIQSVATARAVRKAKAFPSHNDLRLFSRQPDTSLHCKTTDTDGTGAFARCACTDVLLFSSVCSTVRAMQLSWHFTSVCFCHCVCTLFRRNWAELRFQFRGLIHKTSWNEH